jgi:hypothetical protein
MATMTKPITAPGRWILGWASKTAGLDPSYDDVIAATVEGIEREMLARFEDHHPQIGSDISDDMWLECSCGWDASEPKAVDWHQHVVDALSKDRKAST